MPPNSRFLISLAALVIGETLATSQTSRAPEPPATVRVEKKSALDKETLKAYLQYAMLWIPPFQVEIGDPEPSTQLPGFYEVRAKLRLNQLSETVPFLVSKDGRKILQAKIYDIAANPFQRELNNLRTERQPSIGSPGAPVAIVLFTDFQCPFCKEEAKMLRENLVSAYPTQVQLFFKDLPLEQLHPWAKMASMAGRCIFRQNASVFWQYHDWVYANQSNIGIQSLQGMVIDWAKGAGLDVLQLSTCIDTRATEAEVNASIAEATILHVNRTPTMFVNGRRLTGQLSWPDLRNIIDYELQYQTAKPQRGDGHSWPGSAPIP